MSDATGSGAPRAAEQSPPPAGGGADALNRPGRYRRTFGGLIASLVAALALIAAVWGLTWFQHRDIPNPSPTIDYSPTLAQARAASPFPILAPEPAPAGWRATSASWDGTGPEYAWHLGFLAGSGGDVEYVGLEQGNAPPADFIAASTRADQPGSPLVIDGKAWQPLTSSGGENALVRSVHGVTTVVTGTAPQAELVAFVKTLRAR